MKYKDINDNLKKYGYHRESTGFSYEKAVITGDYLRKHMNQTKFYDCTIDKATFDEASFTGAIFVNCIFLDVSLDEADLEFCSFTGCVFSVNKEIKCSFNNSDFISCDFNGTHFVSCTFTGSLFENCKLSSVTIQHSTLENAKFKSCEFYHMNIRDLNMDYVEIEKPYMDDVVLPMEQLPFMFGCLEYIMATKDNIHISRGINETVEVDEYTNKVLELLKEKYIKEEEYFPLANLLLCKKEQQKAILALQKGITKAVYIKDFRLLKFYCKLIVYNKCFSPAMLRNFYKLICASIPQGIIHEIDIKNYIRNIGEIRFALFDSVKKPTLTFCFLTNFLTKDVDKLSFIIKYLFKMSKMNLSNASQENEVSIELSENSPLMISLKVSGDEQNLYHLLPILFQLGNNKDDLTYTNSDFIKLIESDIDTHKSLLSTFYEHRDGQDLTLSVTEYTFENYELLQNCPFPPLFFNTTYNKTKDYILA